MVENVIQIKSGITINIDHACEKDYIWNPATCSSENFKYLASIIVLLTTQWLRVMKL